MPADLTPEVTRMNVPALFSLLAGGMAVALEICLSGRTPGLGWLAFVAATWLAVTFLARRLEREPAVWVRLLWLAPALMAGSLAVHDGHVIQGAAPLLCALTLVLCTYWTLAGKVSLERFRWAPVPLLSGVAMAAPEGARSLRRMDLAGRSDLVWRAMQGIVLAAPLVAVFALLFASSDRLYGDLLSKTLEHATGDVGMPAVRIALMAVVLLGLIHRLVYPSGPPPEPAQEGRQGDPLVLGVMLGAVNLLFLSFLVVQARYLFAGRAAMLVPGLTWAEYVHRGFFELVAATVLVLAVTWGAFRSSNRQEGGAWPLALSILLILQAYGVAASAMLRLGLYMEAYGLTVLRLYVAASMVGICLVLALVAAAGATRRSFAWLASRAAFAGVLLVALTLSLDVEGFVARTNVAQPGADLEYLGTLSADAAPALASLLDSEDPAVRDRARVALDALGTRVTAERMQGWQSFNLSRHRAASLLPRPLAGR